MKYKYFKMCCGGKSSRYSQYKIDKELMLDRLDAPNMVQNSQKMEILSNTAFSDYHIKLMPHIKNRSLEQTTRLSNLAMQDAQWLLGRQNVKKDQTTTKIDDYLNGVMGGNRNPRTNTAVPDLGNFQPEYQRPYSLKLDESS